MKTKKFEIPSDLMAEFAELLSDSCLENEISGRADENIIVSVNYEPEERQQLYELLEWYDDNVEEED